MSFLSACRHNRRETSGAWRPFIAVLYLTYRCDARCFYCSDGHGRPYHTLRQEELSADALMPVLRAIRQSVDYLVITGGEPLLHHDLVRVLEQAAALGFREIILTTNGHLLERYREVISRTVTELVVSVDTMDASRAAAFSGTDAAVAEGVLRSLAAFPRNARTGRITISSVATPRNLEDLEAVYRYAAGRGYGFACAPQLLGRTPHSGLRGNEEYRRFYNLLLEQKRRGASVFGTPLYLEYMRDLRDFRCRPFTMMVIAPTGELFYPCLEIGNLLGRIDSFPSLDAARRIGEARYGPVPSCGNGCHSACALSFGLAFDRPISLIAEALCRVRGAVSGARSGRTGGSADRRSADSDYSIS